MTVAPGRHVVVVDGSNLATEGRTTPSLRQLDEAVRAYAAEDPDADIVVVVDASFEHRIDPSERKRLIDAELHGEVVSPPAGAIGRGDAFVLRIAERTGARVLSNDSFQEFHAEHPWLFDSGRLVGGKPVPGVGWIFTPRIPVRGPKSRQATGKAKRKDTQELSPPVKAAELAKAAKKVAARKAPALTLPDGSKPKVGDVWPVVGATADGSAGAGGKRKSKKGGAQASTQKAEKSKAVKSPADREKAKKSASAGETTKVVEERAAAQKRSAKGKLPKDADRREAAAKESAVKSAATKSAATKKAPAKSAATKKAPAKAATAKKAAPKEATAKKAGAKMSAAKKSTEKEVAPTRAPATKSTGSAAEASPAKPVVVPGAANGAAKAARSTAAKNPVVQEAIGHALAEAIAPADTGDDGAQGRGDQKRGKQDGKGGRHRRRRSSSPPPAVNEPLAFITFVATYPLDSELEGEVVSFTSHGAMVDVDLPEGGVLHSYIPLAAMGDPPPTKARQVLQRGERRTFVLVALDPPRRVAELALPELVAAHGTARR